MEEVGRGLQPDERAELEKVFGSSVDYSQIYIKEGYAGVATWTSDDRVLTHGNTIYMKVHKPDASDVIYQQDPTRNYQDDLNKWHQTLVHESTHVWQGQNGGTDYMSESLASQLYSNYIEGTRDAAYNYEPTLLQEHKKFSELNPEQQANLIDDAQKAGYFDTGVWGESYTDQNGQKQTRVRQDLTDFMNNSQIAQQIKNGEGAP